MLNSSNYFGNYKYKKWVITRSMSATKSVKVTHQPVKWIKLQGKTIIKPLETKPEVVSHYFLRSSKSLLLEEYGQKCNMKSNQNQHWQDTQLQSMFKRDNFFHKKRYHRNHWMCDWLCHFIQGSQHTKVCLKKTPHNLLDVLSKMS